MAGNEKGKKDPRRDAGILSLALMALTAAAVLAWFSCFSMTDFNKKVDYYDGSTRVCTAATQDEDCDIENCEHCNEESGFCEPDPSRNAQNLDGDNAYVCDDGGTDCDDDDYLVFPGASERCNLKDDDCDGTIDEGLFAADAADAAEIAPAANPSVDYDGLNAAVVWEVEETEGTYQKRIKFATLTAGGTLLAESQLTDGFSNYNMESPSIAYRTGSDLATEYGAAWIDRLGGDSLCFAKFSARDLPLNSGEFAVVPGSAGERLSLPQVARGPGSGYYAVAWQQQTGDDASTADIFLAFFDPAGSVSLIDDPGLINVSESSGVKSTSPSVALVGNGVVVAWVEEESATESRVMAARFIGPSGVKVGDTVDLDIASLQRPSNPRLAERRGEPGDDALCLVYDALPLSETREEIFMVLMDPGGFDSAAQVFSAPLQVSDTPDRSVTPSVFWHSAMIGIAWSERSDPNAAWFARMSVDGVAASDPIDAGQGLAPALASQGSDDAFALFRYRPAVEAGDADTVLVRLIGCPD